MEKLPADIILDILCRLPYETMINCKLVCKPRRDISSNIKVGLLFQIGREPALKFCFGGEEYDDIDMHGHYSYKTLVEIDNHRSIEIEEPLTEMVVSCNGMVCFSVKGKSSLARDPIYICNPITEEYVYLPPFNNYEIYNGKLIGCVICRFGYYQSTDEYKVVRIYIRDGSRREVEVYTLGSGHGWRPKGKTGHVFDIKPGVCANGALHWIEYSTKKIVAFKFADEEFQLIPPPALQKRRVTLRFALDFPNSLRCVVMKRIYHEAPLHPAFRALLSKFFQFAPKRI
ncbi:putative F-box protein At1g55070 [Papaver somniferum]|uniref:putative F-box protein At1g55070 n=1 Tax=Papaver somniferum TaxID=3469 RepID=UPI000E6FDEA4|nr:putative F-box protein At1g55070 [Papaver somniferum]